MERINLYSTRDRSKKIDTYPTHLFLGQFGLDGIKN
jgi:hypothetical protein